MEECDGCKELRKEMALLKEEFLEWEQYCGHYNEVVSVALKAISVCYDSLSNLPPAPSLLLDQD